MVSRYKKGFMLVTVLLVLLLLAVLSVGILYLSSTGIQRTSAYTDTGISYVNALSGANMVSAFFQTINRTPPWPAGEEFQNLPAELQAPYPVSVTGTDGTPAVIGEFEVLSIERLLGSNGPNVVPQDFEVMIAGRSAGPQGDMSNEVLMRMRLRVEADTFTRWVYFLNTHPSDIWWIGTNDKVGRGTRLHGPVHFNEKTNLYNTAGWYFDPEDPIFVSWDYGRTPNLSVVADGNFTNTFRWGSKPLNKWNYDEQYRDYLWGSSGNLNEGWFGVAGWANQDLGITYGGWNQINNNPEYVNFPTRDDTEAIRNQIWNGDPESKPPQNPNGGYQPAPDHNPECVVIPDPSRQDGGIFIYGDVSMHFEALDSGLTDGNGNKVYNNQIIIEQPPYQAAAHSKNLLFRWTIDIERDEEGNPVRMTRRFYRLTYNKNNEISNVEQVPVFRNSSQMEEIFDGPFNDEGLGIYVDGNIGWIDNGDTDKFWLSQKGQGITLSNEKSKQQWAKDRSIRGLSGETYGRITIYTSMDVVISDNFVFKDYQVPMSPDFTPYDYSQVQYVNGIVARNVAIFPFFYDPEDGVSRNFDTPFYVDAGIICTGLSQSGGSSNRTHGSMGNMLYFKNFGTPSSNLPTALNGPDPLDGTYQKGRFFLRGSYAANNRTAFGTMSSTYLQGMTHSWYYDLRFRIMTPPFYPQAGLRARIFELSKVN